MSGVGKIFIFLNVFERGLLCLQIMQLFNQK